MQFGTQHKALHKNNTQQCTQGHTAGIYYYTTVVLSANNKQMANGIKSSADKLDWQQQSSTVSEACPARTLPVPYLILRQLGGGSTEFLQKL